MATAIWIAFAVLAGLMAYWFILRPYLKRLPMLADVYAFLDAYGAGAFGKLRVSLSGLKRTLFARLVWVSGLLLAVQAFLSSNQGLIEPLIPEKYRPYTWLALAAAGAIFEWLSKISPTPEGQVNPGVVAAVTAAPMTTVANITAPDPIVAQPTPEQMAGRA